MATTGAKTQLISAPARTQFVHSPEIDQIMREQLTELITVIDSHADDCRCKNCRRYVKVQLILLEVFD